MGTSKTLKEAIAEALNTMLRAEPQNMKMFPKPETEFDDKSWQVVLIWEYVKDRVSQSFGVLETTEAARLWNEIFPEDKR